MADHLRQPPYCAEMGTGAQGGPEIGQCHPVARGRVYRAGASDSWLGVPPVAHVATHGLLVCSPAGPLSVHCVSHCSVVRFKNGQGSNLDGGNYHVYENGSLEIKMIRKEDQGIYTCVATNILGKAENQVRLEVKGKGGGRWDAAPRSHPV